MAAGGAGPGRFLQPIDIIDVLKLYGFSVTYQFLYKDFSGRSMAEKTRKSGQKSKQYQ